MKLFDNILAAWKRWSQEGMRWPFIHDPVKSQPSVTLLFFYISFILLCTAVIASSTMMVIKGDYFTATIMPCIMWFSAFVFYRLRRLDNVEIDFDDKQIKLGGGEDEKEE